MSSGQPLNDADRWDWLIKLREHCVSELLKGSAGVVLTCSALKKKYRDVLRIASYHHDTILVHFAYLKATREMLLARVRARQGHYMKDDMVFSQLEDLQAPTEDERDCISVEVAGTPVEVNELVLNDVKKALEHVIRKQHYTEE